MEWNFLDIVFGILILLLAVRGLIRGFIGEVFSVGAVVVGIGAAVIFSSVLAGPVEEMLNIRGWGQVIAFLGIFLVVYIVLKIVEKALKGVIENIHLENLDRALGLFLGIVEGLVVVGALVLMLRLQPFFDFSASLEESTVVRILTPLLVYGARSLNFKI